MTDVWCWHHCMAERYCAPMKQIAMVGSSDSVYARQKTDYHRCNENKHMPGPPFSISSSPSCSKLPSCHLYAVYIKHIKQAFHSASTAATTTTAATSFCASALCACWCSRAVEQAIVDASVPPHFKMLAQPRVTHHGRRVAADEHWLVGDESVMIIKIISMGVARDCTLVDCHLAIVFTEGLELVWQLEQPAT